MYGLGCLLRWLILDSHSDIEPIPERRVSLERLRSSWGGFHRRAVLTLCDRATDDVPSRRPPARRFASDLLQTVPGAVLAAREPSSEDVVRPRTRLGKVVGFVLVTLIGALGFVSHRGGGSETSAGAVATDRSELTSRPTATAATTDPVHVEDERVIVVGARRFQAGQPGDRVAVGDWSCTGTASVAVLRPASGAIFIFDRWATAAADVTVPPITTVRGAVDLQTRDRGDGCSSLVALLPDGTEKEVT